MTSTVHCIASFPILHHSYRTAVIACSTAIIACRTAIIELSLLAVQVLLLAGQLSLLAVQVLLLAGSLVPRPPPSFPLLAVLQATGSWAGAWERG